MAETFEQTQSIVSRIQQILREYPCGDQILYELLQNADDSRADKAWIQLDCRPRSSKWGAAATPSLLFANSSVFTESDLKNIQSIGGTAEHSKRRDASRIGRFGVGFNSVYHLADTVSFVTVDSLISFDPIRGNLPQPKSGAMTGGLRWNLRELDKLEGEDAEYVNEVLTAFENSGLGFNRNETFKGTIFRLPLRTAPGKLWREVHSVGAVAELVDEFREAVQAALVLMKNVKSVSASVVEPCGKTYQLYSVNAVKGQGFLSGAASPGPATAGGGGQKRLPQLVGDQQEDTHRPVTAKIIEWLKKYSTTMNNLTTAAEADPFADNSIADPFLNQLPAPVTLQAAIDLQISYSDLTALALSGAPPSTKEENLGMVAQVKHKTAATAVSAQPPPVGSFALEMTEAQAQLKSEQKHVEVKNFQLIHKLGPGGTQGWRDSGCWKLAAMSAIKQHPISVPWSATICESAKPADGRLLCFFPIRGSTKLPMHIHGYFQLSSDRQSIIGVERSEWNKAMSHEVIPFGYSTMISHLVTSGVPTYELWPSGVYTDTTIATMAKAIVAQLAKIPCIISPEKKTTPLEVDFAPEEMSLDAHTLFVEYMRKADRDYAGSRILLACYCDSAGQNRTMVRKEIQALKVIESCLRKNGFDPKVLSTDSIVRLLEGLDLRRLSAELGLEFISLCTGSKLKVTDNADSPEVRLARANLIRACRGSEIIPMLEGGCERLPDLTDGALSKNSSMVRNSASSGSFVKPPPSGPKEALLLPTSTPVSDLLASFSVHDFVVTTARPGEDNPRLLAAVSRLLMLAKGTEPHCKGIQETTAKVFAARIKDDLAHASAIAEMSDLSGGVLSPTTNWSLRFPLADKDRVKAQSERASASNAPTRILLRDFYKYLDSLDSQSLEHFFTLKILPKKLEPDGEGDLAMTTTLVVAAAPVVKDKEVTIAFLDEVPETKAITGILSKCGAQQIESCLVPHSLLKKIAEARTTSLSLISGDSASSVLFTLSSLLDKELSAPGDASSGAAHGKGPVLFQRLREPSTATAIVKYFSTTYRGLKVEDQDMIRTFPIFTDIRGRPVDLQNAYLLPVGLAAAARSVLQNISDEKQKRLFQDITFVEPGSKEFMGFLELLKVPKITQAVILTLIAPLLPPPFPTTNDGAVVAQAAAAKFFLPKGCSREDVNEVWLSLINSFARADQHGQMIESSQESSLFAKAKEQLIKFPFLPSAFQLRDYDLEMDADQLVKRVAVEHCVLPSAADPIMTEFLNECWRLSHPSKRAVVSASPENEGGEGAAVQQEAEAARTKTPPPVPMQEQHHSSGEVKVQREILAARGAFVSGSGSFGSQSSFDATTTTVLASVPAVAYTMMFGPEHEAKVISALKYLGVPSTLDGPQLVTCCKALHWRATTPGVQEVLNNSIISPPPAAFHEDPVKKKVTSAATAGGGSPGAKQAAPVPSQRRGPTPPPGNPIDRMVDFACVVLSQVEQSVGLTTNDWEVIGSSHIVPVIKTTVSDDGRVDREPLLTKPTNAVVGDVHQLCPTMTRMRLLPAFTRFMEGHRGYFQCNRKFHWDSEPSPQAIVDFINWCGTAPLPKVVRLGHDIWSSYAHLNALLIKANGSTGGNNSSQNFANADIRSAIQNLKFFYFPERKLAFSVNYLALHKEAQVLEPHLSSMDEITAQKFPDLIKELALPRQHRSKTVLDLIDKLGHEANPHLDEELKQILAHEKAKAKQPSTAERPPAYTAVISESLRHRLGLALDYLVLVASEEEIKKHSHRLPMPTTDGSVHPAKNVAYDFFNTKNDLQAHDILHSSVSSDVARALGMLHIGHRYLKDLHPKYAKNNSRRQGGFNVRGQHQDLKNAITRILGDYSDTQSIIMEMLQNADDSGASEMRVILDERSFKTEKEGLLGEGMSRCQGPALVVTNNSMFTPADFDALMEIGCGHKAKDQLSIGRFGVGFNSVYHITDCPSIVSGDQVVYLDPSATHIEMASKDAPGLSINFVDEPHLKTHFPNQFEPYAMYDTNLDKLFKGTVFRLPIRTNFVEGSSMSKRTWKLNDARNLMREFAQRLDHLMLFLKNITSIQLLEVSSSGEMTMTHRAQFANKSEVEHYRHQILESIAVSHIEKPLKPDVLAHCDHKLLLTTGNDKPICRVWGVTSCLLDIHRVPKLPKAAPDGIKRKLIPLGGVAFPIDLPPNAVPGQPLRPARLPNDKALMHCFLPMPVKTHLPCHTNGCFALSSDRRGMWLDSLGDTESWEVIWNKFVLDQAVGKAYAESLAHRAGHRSESGQYTGHSLSIPLGLSWKWYELFPMQQKNSTEIFNAVHDGFFEYVVQHDCRIFWSEPSSKFVHAGETVLSVKGSLSEGTDAAASGTEDVKSKLPLAVAQLIMADETLSEVDADLFAAVALACKKLALESPAQLGPTKVANSLRRRAAVVSRGVTELPASTLLPSLPQPTDKKSLAAILVKLAIHFFENGKADISGCPLVLLSAYEHTVGFVDVENNTYLSATSENNERMKNLFGNAGQSLLVDPFFWLELARYTHSKEIKDYLGISDLKIEVMAKLLRKHSVYIPQTSLGSQLTWPAKYDSNMALWLKHLWKTLASLAADLTEDSLKNYGELARWPLIPANRKKEHVLIPLGKAALVATGTADSTVEEALLHLNVWILDSQFAEHKTIIKMCKIDGIDSGSVGALMLKAREQGRFNEMDADQRELLLKWLINTGSSSRTMFGKVGAWMSGDQKIPIAKDLRQLPLYEKLDAGEWKWSWMTSDSDRALPDGVPQTKLCDGYFRKAVPEVDLKKATMTDFYLGRYIPMVASAQWDDWITPWEEVDYLRILGRNPETLKQVAGSMQNIQFVPLESAGSTMRQLKPTTAGGKEDEANDELRLMNQLLNYIVKHKISYQETLKGKPSLLQKLDRKEYSALDMTNRVHASQCLRPLFCRTSLIPNVLTLLSQVSSELKFHVVPEVMWRDVYVREVLIAAGLPKEVPQAQLEQASDMVEKIATTWTEAAVKSAIATCGYNEEMISYEEFIDQLSVSIVQTLHEIGVDSSLPSVLTKTMFVGHPLIPRREETIIFSREQSTVGCGGWFCGADASPSSKKPHAPKKKKTKNTCVDTYSATSMVRFKHRFIGGCIKPIASPHLDDEKLIPDPDTETVVANLLHVCEHQGLYSQELADEILAACYTELNKISPKELVDHTTMQTKAVFACKERLADSGHRRMVSLHHILTDRQTGTLGSMSPYYFHARDFSVECQRLLNWLPENELPDCNDIIDALFGNGNLIRNANVAVEDRMTLNPHFLAHFDLLRLMGMSAEGKHDLSDASTTLGQRVAKVSIPLTNNLMTPIPKGTLADNRALLRRLQPRSINLVHGSLPLPLCASLGIPSLAVVLKENVADIRELPPSEVPESQECWNNFFRNPMSRRVLLRLMAGDEAPEDKKKKKADEKKSGESSLEARRRKKSAEQGGGELKIAWGAEHVGMERQDSEHLSKEEKMNIMFDKMAKIRVKFVQSMTCTIFDKRNPSKDIAASNESPLAATDEDTMTVYMSLSSNRTRLGGFIVPPHMLLAMEVDKIFAGGVVRHMMPLAAALETIGAEGKDGHSLNKTIHLQLDHFGCVDLLPPNAVGIGLPINEDDLARFGQCRLVDDDPSVLLAVTKGRHGRELDPERLLVNMGGVHYRSQPRVSFVSPITNINNHTVVGVRDSRGILSWQKYDMQNPNVAANMAEDDAVFMPMCLTPK